MIHNRGHGLTNVYKNMVALTYVNHWQNKGIIFTYHSLYKCFCSKYLPDKDVGKQTGCLLLNPHPWLRLSIQKCMRYCCVCLRLKSFKTPTVVPATGIFHTLLLMKTLFSCYTTYRTHPQYVNINKCYLVHFRSSFVCFLCKRHSADSA